MLGYNCIPLQAQLKEAQHDVDEANKARDDLASRLKELEKKIRNYEAELNNAQEVHASMKFNLVSFPGTFPPPVFDLQKWTTSAQKLEAGKAWEHGQFNLCQILSVKV